MAYVSSGNRIGSPSFSLGTEVIATILDILQVGWSAVLARKVLAPTSQEVDIAGQLGREVLAEKKRRRISNLRIEEEVGTRASAQSPKPEGRIDIKVIYSFDEDEYFGIECKRVSGNKSDRLARKYVENGMLRFVTGKYSPGHEWAAMMGFVVDGQTDLSIRLIVDEIAAHKMELGLDGEWMAEMGFSGPSHLYKTGHKQTHLGTRITILHLFLNLN
ncbi:MAG TPA: hypothetical protein VFJ30_14330 [Phycisphaerae bacterium]|nr:hypothetical protein [Phycisphaerae bacterium]